MMNIEISQCHGLSEACEWDVTFPSNFRRNMFTMAAFDNCDHEEVSLSGIGVSHDKFTLVFQDEADQK